MVKAQTSETNPDSMGFLAPGRYLFTVNDITQPQDDKLKVEFTVVAGFPTDPNDGPQDKKTFSDYLNLYGKAASRLLQWACAVGLITKDEWRASREGQGEIEFDEMQAIGRVFCGEIQNKPYAGQKEEHKGKSFPSLDFRIWAIDDEKAIDIVSHPSVMPHVKGLLPADHFTKHKAGGKGPGDAAAPAKQQPSKPAPTAAAAAAPAADAFDMF